MHDDLAQMIMLVQRKLLRPLDPTKVDRVLIVKLDRIGDLVNSTPIFDALRSLMPHAKIDIVAHPMPLTLLEDDPRIHQRFDYKTWMYHALPILPPGFRELLVLGRTIKRTYQLVVVLRGSFPFLVLGLTSRLAAIKFVESEHVIDRYMRPLESLFGTLTRSCTSLIIGERTLRNGRDIVGSASATNGPIVAIHASSTTPTRQWPVERFACLADRLHGQYGASVHFFGGPGDEGRLNTITQLTSKQHEYHVGPSLRDVAASIASSDLFIGNDSGLAHIATAVGTPTIVVWGSANLTMARPDGDPSRCKVVYELMDCRKACPEFACCNPNQFECLTRIDVSRVMGAAAELLGLHGTQGLPIVWTTRISPTTSTSRDSE